MRQSIRIGRIAGIDVEVNGSVLVVLGLLSWALSGSLLPAAAPGEPSVAYRIAGVVVAAVFLVCVLAHELAHAMVARWCGTGVRRITLWLLGGVSEFDDEPANPSAEFVIAVAGPLMSVTVGIAAGLAAVWARAAGFGDLATAATRADRPDVDAAWIEAVRDDCPHPEHVAAYARIVETAAFRRDIASHAERISAQAADPQSRGLAAALAQQVEANAALTASVTEPSPRGPTRPAAELHLNREDAILAGLLRQPERIDDVAKFLPAEAFSAHGRRDVYQAILTLAQATEPVDEITVAWELERRRAEARLFPDRPAASSSVADAHYLERLVATPTAETAIEAGRTLLANHLRSTLTGRRADPDPTVVTNPVTAVDPGLRRPPAPDGGPAPRISPAGP